MGTAVLWAKRPEFQCHLGNPTAPLGAVVGFVDHIVLGMEEAGAHTAHVPALVDKPPILVAYKLSHLRGLMTTCLSFFDIGIYSKQ